MFRRIHPSGSSWILLAAGILASVAIGTTLYSYENTLLVCPGCNPPEMVRIDHYTIQNNTSQQPTLLTLWLASTGPAGKSLTLQALYLPDGPLKYPDCHWIPYNESSCLTPYTINNLKLPALSQVTVSIDTTSQGFYFTPGTHPLDIVTDQSWFGLQITYPPTLP